MTGIDSHRQRSAGWRRSECIKPVAGGDSCQARHIGTIISGRMHIVHDEGIESDAGPATPM